jgi:hypothetical protein
VNKNHKTQIAIYERFHLICLDFFFVSFVYAIFQDAFFLSFLILLSNIVYNIIPILIQQYNKLRLGDVEWCPCVWGAFQIYNPGLLGRSVVLGQGA